MLVLLAGCLLPAGAAFAQTTVKYIHTDALGSVVAVTDQNRNVLERREYEPYGQQLTPALADGPGYTGHVQDAATGLTYMQQRYYDPLCGCFLSVDPVTAYDNPVTQFHRYRYGNNNPYSFSDPDGRLGQVAVGGIIGGVIGGGLEVYKQVKAGEGISIRSIAVETGRGGLIGMATSVAGPAALAAARAQQLTRASMVTAEVTAASATAGYATLATGPAADVLKGNPAQSLQSHGPEAAAAMAGTLAGAAAGKAVSGVLSQSSGHSSVAVGAVARAAEESISVGVSSSVGSRAERDPPPEIRRDR
ncbi:RHS repeat-associated core domain-containing protein [Luteimonas sp. RD2P54]|uniref:RHS repeat-associated core domain-containing protein n=1 Tax=Luteimonas endophytica TaxID=3042023 RepID=A0ABT6J8J4_9GAMM|nr:RHS repeat-associated core domain-containing protein [Luteimonas endophytica]MDH5822518.1 RHS repeat-associated core domain-containing protein [Luteimonas endophytica]